MSRKIIGVTVGTSISPEALKKKMGIESGSGGNADYVGVEPAADDIPKVFITGVKPTTKDDVLAEMEYVSKTDKFHAYLTIKCQGNSSMSYPKKNFTVKMFSDEARVTKLKKSFKDWNHNGNKYVLKANWIDHSHARNIVSARLWGEVVAIRPDYDSLPVEMRNSPNNGAVDGFPIKVYYNGTYEGLYTWNIGKDDWQWGMDEDNPNHVLMCAETNTNGNKTATPCNFRALWNGVNESNWSVEVGTNSTALKNSLNNLIQFVIDNDGDDFRNGIGNYLDIQSAIDYYIFVYDICGLDSLARNMLLATYDGTKWICGAYDLDSTFGMWWNGSSFVSAQYACPEDYQENYSLLWERIEANFLPELKARQAELRKTVLSYSNIVTHFERFMDIIGLDLYAEDLTVYTGIPSGSTNNIKQIRNYIRDRHAYVDAEFASMSAPVPCTGISLNANTMTFTAEGSQTLTATVTPGGCTDTVTWESNNTSVATVSGGVVTAIANGSATITAKCGEYSASCFVAVSGIAKAVPCTGITLDKTELTFASEVTQTITATVTPSDTTDKIVWSSDNPAIATVNNGVVTPVGDGSAIITATCGSQSATCSISVSGVAVVVTWTDTAEYNFNQTTGEVVSGDCYVSSLFAPECGYQYALKSTSEYDYPRVACYTEEGNFVKYHSPAGKDINFNVYDLGGANDIEKVRLGIHPVNANFDPTKVSLEKIGVWSATNVMVDKGTGMIVNGGANDRVTLQKIPVEAGAKYRLANINSGVSTWKGFAEYDADGAFIKLSEGGNTVDAYEKTMESNTAYVVAKAVSAIDLNGNIEITRVQ